MKCKDAVDMWITNRSNSLLCLSTCHLDYRQSPVDRPPMAVNTLSESRVLFRLAQSVKALGLRAVFKSNSEFVSDLKLECLISLFSWALWLYKEGYCPLLIVSYT